MGNLDTLHGKQDLRRVISRRVYKPIGQEHSFESGEILKYPEVLYVGRSQSNMQSNKIWRKIFAQSCMVKREVE